MTSTAPVSPISVATSDHTDVPGLKLDGGSSIRTSALARMVEFQRLLTAVEAKARAAAESKKKSKNPKTCPRGHLCGPATKKCSYVGENGIRCNLDIPKSQNKNAIAQRLHREKKACKKKEDKHRICLICQQNLKVGERLAISLCGFIGDVGDSVNYIRPHHGITQEQVGVIERLDLVGRTASVRFSATRYYRIPFCQLIAASGVQNGPCGRTFHVQCLEKYVKRKNSEIPNTNRCPKCLNCNRWCLAPFYCEVFGPFSSR